MALLQRGIEAILDSEGFTATFRMMARFPASSATNVCLILA